MPTQINLDGVVPRGELALTREEHPDERAARLKKEANETTARLKQEGRCCRVFPLRSPIELSFTRSVDNPFSGP
jgi:hypothetical protein